MAQMLSGYSIAGNTYAHRTASRWLLTNSGLIAILVLVGCSNRPRPLVAPKIDADAATKSAFETYDSNSDGELSKEELAACPGLLAALAAYDKDGNQKVSKSEMVERIGSWKNGPAMLTLDCLVTLDGHPISGAVVKFVPEKYLGPYLNPAEGTTGNDGAAVIGVAPEMLPAEHQRLRAVNAGTYRVEITHPSQAIPSKYNSQTTLGREVSRETLSSQIEKFELKSK